MPSLLVRTAVPRCQTSRRPTPRRAGPPGGRGHSRPGAQVIRWGIAIVTGAVSLSLSACGGSEPEDNLSSSTSLASSSLTATPTPSPSSASPTPTPSRTDDVAETVAAAATTSSEPLYDVETGVTTAVQRYYATYNRIAQDPTADPLQIADVALEPEKDQAYNQLTATRAAGQKQLGDIQATVETILPLDDTATDYLADVCVDTRQVDVQDQAGNSLWAADSPRQTYASFYVQRRGAEFFVYQVDHSTDPCGSALTGATAG